jgi:hypothetical protein
MQFLKYIYLFVYLLCIIKDNDESRAMAMKLKGMQPKLQI